MKRVLRAIATGSKNAGRNWKTTGAGVLTLAATGCAVYANPTVLATPEGLAGVVAGLSAGVGLIKAKDADKTGVAAEKK
jgi:hypothetical protein